MKRDILLLLIISAFLLIFNLGSGSLSSWDEAFYAEVSREAVQSGNWVDLTWGSSPWFDKPPLFIWATALFYTLLGVSEFSARFSSALSGILLVIVTYLFGARIFTRRVGFMAAVILLSTYHFLFLARMGTLDCMFTLLVSLSIFFYIRKDGKGASTVLSFAFFGLAFLTKGVGALLIPMILGLYAVLSGARREAFNRYTAIGLLVFFILTSPWYIAGFHNSGRPFLEGHFIHHLIGRTAEAMDAHTGSWITYINVVLYKGKPWGPVGLIAFPFFLASAIREKRHENYILIAWIVVVMAVFTAAKTKLHWYIMPVYPPVALIAAWGMNSILKRYAKISVIAISLISVIYFGAKKDIFTLDYNPEIKRFSAGVVERVKGGGEVYLYDIQDPGMRFYLGGVGKNIYGEEELRRVKGHKGAVVVTRTKDLGETGGAVVFADEKRGYAAVSM